MKERKRRIGEWGKRRRIFYSPTLRFSGARFRDALPEKPTSDTATPDLVPASALGQHTVEILSALGYRADEIEQLKKENVV